MRRNWIAGVHFCGVLDLTAVAAVLLAFLQPTTQGQTPKAGESKNEPRKVIIRLVRKADGQPISGAIVVVSSYYTRHADGLNVEFVADDDLAERFTDDQGCCQIEAPSGETGVIFWLGKEGFVSVSHSLRWIGKTALAYTTAQGRTQQEVREGTVPTISQELEPGDVIGGLVKDVQGRPIEGAEVTLEFDDFGVGVGVIVGKREGDVLTRSNRVPVNGTFPYLRVKTDPQGRWRTSSLPADFSPKGLVLVRVAIRSCMSDTGVYQRQLSL